MPVLFKSSTLPACTVAAALLLVSSFACSSARPVEVMAEAPATQAQQADDTNLIWHDARTLTIEGRGWDDTETFFERLPARAQDNVTDEVWALSKDTAGIVVRFVTDSPRIAVRWDGGGAMYHMAATGNSGLDLYVRDKRTAYEDTGSWRFRAVGKPDTTTTTRVLATGCPPAPTDYLLYLPLYQKVSELMIGIEPGSSLRAGPPRSDIRNKPIVFYGTSITQGGCACRAGMCHAAILGRWLDRPVINLGFSGAGKMEMAMADLLAELDASIYVLECLPNMTTQMVRERVMPFIRQLRSKQPTTPILLVESPFNPDTDPGTAALREAYEALLAEGVQQLYKLSGNGQLDGRENGTVDGVHPTDLGFLRMAEAYEPVLRSILQVSP
ncbi:MAG: SGNH/GDSL hydrolase family protein [Phycisphaerales bacterium]|nr:SGNH/GDSL hydrolase family protein [Phycisphaerales bacterium]